MYMVFDPSQPHIILDIAATLDDIAAALAARPEPDLTVCFNRDGLTRNLNPGERRELDALLDAPR